MGSLAIRSSRGVCTSSQHCTDDSPPDSLLGLQLSPNANSRTKKARIMSSAVVSSTSSPDWVVIPPSQGPTTRTVTCATTPHNSRFTTPSLIHPRPQSFAGFPRWINLTSTPPSSLPLAQTPETPGTVGFPRSTSVPVNMFQTSSNLDESQRNSIIVLEENVCAE